MRGIANSPGKKPTAEGLGAQSKLSGAEGQYVGFDKDGNAVSKDFPKIGEGTGAAFFGTIGTEWEVDASTGVKHQMVPVDGVIADHVGTVDVIMTHERTSDGYANFIEEQNQFLDFITNGDAETVDGGVMFYIYGDPNTIEIPFCVEVV